MHLDIGNRLAIYGWKKEEEDFFFIMAKIWWKFDFINVEQLLFKPSTGSLPYVKAVREKSGLLQLAEEEILQTLTNLRKNGFLDAVKNEV